MEFQAKTIDKIVRDYNQALPFFGDRGKNIQERIEKLSKTEALFMKYLFAYMPLSDVGEYDFDVFYSYAKHTAYLLEHSPYIKEMPEDYIFNYVLSHRINSEDITDCRRFFCDLVKDRIQGLTLKEAVLEINDWCYEQATYRSTSIRTASPITVYKGGFGRCGEESTFLVTILRSVGIAARQIYVPRWSHSDSNHAWVEIWDGGQWYFIGACEPKPIFNNGWFTYPASRAMVVHSRVFSGFGCEAEEIVEQDGTVTLINNSSMYAKVKPFKVIVKAENQEPIKGALVRFEIINSAEFFPITTLKTNEKGEASIRLGQGDIHLHVLYNGKGKMRIVNVKDTDEVTFTLYQKDETKYNQWNKFWIGAPDCADVSAVDMTPDEEKEQDDKNKVADVIRQNRINSYYDEAYAKQFENYSGISRALSEAKGNFDEIRCFLDEKNTGKSISQKDLLLSVLAKKDFRDTKEEILVSHLEAFQFEGEYDEDIFSHYVLSPNVYMEKMSDFRSYIRNSFGLQGAEWVKKPEELWEFIQKEIIYYPEREYTTIIGTPESAMNVKAGSPMTKKVLFVAICRTYGLAAKLDDIYLEPQFFNGEKFIFVDEKLRRTAQLQLNITDDKIPNYYQQFTLGYQIEDGSYVTLELWRKEFEDGKLALTLLPGTYRVLTNERMTSGSVIGAEYYITLQEGDQKDIELYCNLIDAKELRVNLKLDDFNLQTLEGAAISSKDICGEEKNLLLFIETGKEPTEHLFNEMLEMAKMSGLQNCNIHFVVKDDKEFNDETFIKVRKAYHNLFFWKDENDEALSLLEEATGVDKKKLPVAVVTEGHQKGLYACCGYQVGSVDMFARVIGSEQKMEKLENLANVEAIRRVREIVWKEYLQKLSEDEVRKSEVDNRVMKYQDVEMKYGLQIIGEPDEKGYPLFIALHGGGQGDTPDLNDSQWMHMAVYYKMGITNGVYVNPRGVRDTWDTHGNPESFPLYDRLIENMILHCNVNPNRVYIMGFSAGGDGVYIVAPRMADRFAAAHMSAGHHNGTSVTNLHNTPIQLQVGELDIAYNRHKVTVEYDMKLDELAKTYGGGFTHNVFVHYQKGHNFDDNKLSPQEVYVDNIAWYNEEEVSTITADTNAVHFLEKYTRNPLPNRVIWDLGNRANLRNATSFYWLKADYSVTEGEIVAKYEKENNTIIIEKETVDGRFSILINEEMLDVFSSIRVVAPKGTFEVMPEITTEHIVDTTYERGDYNYQFVAEIDYSKLQ